MCFVCLLPATCAFLHASASSCLPFSPSHSTFAAHSPLLSIACTFLVTCFCHTHMTFFFPHCVWVHGRRDSWLDGTGFMTHCLTDMGMTVYTLPLPCLALLPLPFSHLFHVQDWSLPHTHGSGGISTPSPHLLSRCVILPLHLTFVSPTCKPFFAALFCLLHSLFCYHFHSHNFFPCMHLHEKDFAFLCAF